MSWLKFKHSLHRLEFVNPRRMTNGIDVNRVLLLIAVLEKRARMNLSNSDIYVNVAGGLRIDETAVDLGICAAVATSQADIPLPPDMIFIGEVGLGGELRGVSQLEKRINEAAKLGFKSAIVPKQSLRGVKIPDGFAAYGIKTISEMINMLRENDRKATPQLALPTAPLKGSLIGRPLVARFE